MPPDMTLFRTGDPANELYVVAGGAVDLHYERSGSDVLEAARTVGQARLLWRAEQQKLHQVPIVPRSLRGDSEAMEPCAERRRHETRGVLAACSSSGMETGCLPAHATRRALSLI